MISRVGAASLAALLLTACIDQSRVNDRCAWTDGVAGPLDLTSPGGREHLRADAEIANELMVRYGDVYGPHRPDLARPYREQCMRALIETLVATHGVTPAQIAWAERDRVWWADLLFVYLPMAVLAVAATDYATRRICGSFDSEGSVIAGILVGVVALSASGLSLGVTHFWAFVVEGWRLHNGHVSNRGSLIPIVTHAWTCVGIAILLCIPTAILRFRRTPLSGSSTAHYAGLRLGPQRR